MFGLQVQLKAGLHSGWVIEGAVGSSHKIDASYLSPHVNMAARIETATFQVRLPRDRVHAVKNRDLDRANTALRIMAVWRGVDAVGGRVRPIIIKRPTAPAQARSVGLNAIHDYNCITSLAGLLH